MKKYLFLIFFLFVAIYFIENEDIRIKQNQEYSKSVLYITKSEQIKKIDKTTSVNKFVDFIVKFIIVSYTVFLISEYIDKMYFQKENLTSHYSMKHRMQNPRCKLKPNTHSKMVAL